MADWNMELEATFHLDRLYLWLPVHCRRFLCRETHLHTTQPRIFG